MQWDFLKFAMFTVFKSTTDLHLQGSEVRMTRYKTKPETVMANCAKVSFFILINEDQSSVFCWNGDDYDDPVDDDGDDEYDDYGDDEYDDDYDSGDFNRPPRFQWCCAHIGQGLEFWFARWWSVIIDHANDDHKDDHAEDNDKALDKFHTPLSHLSTEHVHSFVTFSLYGLLKRVYQVMQPAKDSILDTLQSDRSFVKIYPS